MADDKSKTLMLGELKRLVKSISSDPSRVLRPSAAGQTEHTYVNPEHTEHVPFSVDTSTEFEDPTKRIHDMPQRPIILNMQASYRDNDLRHGDVHGSPHDRFVGSREIQVTVDFLLPSSCNPTDFLKQLKNLDLYEPEPSTLVVPLKEYERALARVAQLEKLLSTSENASIRHHRDAESFKDLAKKNEVTLLKLRERMSIALEASRNPDVARELFAELVNSWACQLAEGASFTAAEGDELVESLISFLEYIDVARETLRLECKEEVSKRSQQSEKKDQLF